MTLTTTTPELAACDAELDLYAVFATTVQNRTVRVSDPASYDASLRDWSLLDRVHRLGRMPHVRHYEVRHVTLGPDRALVGPEVRSHDRYDRAPLELQYRRPVTNSRGFKSLESAGRAAWKQFAPTFRSAWDKRRDAHRVELGLEPLGESTGVQGTGGWFYFPNGQTAAQGLSSVGKLARRKGLVVESHGRFYVLMREEL